LIPRLLLSKTKGSRQKIAKTVIGRIELWKTRNFAQLWKDFQLSEKARTYNNPEANKTKTTHAKPQRTNESSRQNCPKQ
jgi:hypothetical protein